MEDSQPRLHHRARRYYEDEDWSPNHHKQQEVILTRSKTNKLPPTKKSCCNILANLPLNSSKNVKERKTLKCKDVEDESESEEHELSTTRHATSSTKKKPAISAYELQIQKNIEERKKIFAMLELGNVKQEFEEIFANSNKRKLDEDDDGNNNPVEQKRGRPLKKDQKFPPKKKESAPPIRMSLRERKATKYFDYLDDVEVSHYPKPSKSYSYTMEEEEEEEEGEEKFSLDCGLPDAPLSMRLRGQRRRKGNSTEVSTGEKTVFSSDTLSLKSTLVDQNSIEEFTKFVNELTPHLGKCESGNKIGVPNDLHEFVEVMKSFELSTYGVPTVVAKRITSLTWHPNSSRPLLAVGDIMGSIGLWDILHESQTQRVSTHDIHASHVRGLNFDKFNPLKLISTSKDGYVRLLDFSTGTIDEIYSVTMTTRDSFPVNHIQKDPFSLLVSIANGQVVTIDMRAMPTQVDQQFKCFEGSIPTLSHHPLDENMFMASCSNGEVSIFDLRYMQPISSTMECTEPVYRLPHTVTRVGGAFFSPLTGDYALVTGKDSFEVFDLRSGITECQTNLDISSLRKEHPALSNAVWHPNREDMCLATESDSGNLEVLGVPNGEHVHSFLDNGIRRQLGINAFHPSLPMFARGSRTNGRVYLYCPPVE